MKLWSELKRRNVVQVTTTYVAVSWLVMQSADFVLDFAGAPDWIGKALLSLLIVGLIPAVALSWLFEVTPAGVQRDDGGEHVGSGVRARRLNVITLVALALLAGLFLWQKQSPALLPVSAEQPPVPTTTDPAGTAGQGEQTAASAEPLVDSASIAVLPFADLSPHKDQEYFSNGIAEEILNVLVGVDGLSVASRTSAFAFKGRQAMGIPAIARSLKVRHVLEGSVRSAGDTIRITAQLIDAASDKHLWSQTYDRVLSTENLFAIQDEIASAIVMELSSALDLEQSELPSVTVEADTDNLAAYELFLRGRRGYMERSTQTIPDTIDLLLQASQADPQFARAWSLLAATYAVAPGWGLADRDYRSLAAQAASTAIDLDPALGLPYAVLGTNINGPGSSDFARSLELYERALERNPNEVNALLWRAIDLTALGYFDRAERDLFRCLEIDPAYQNCKRFLAQARLLSGEVGSALALFEQGLAEGSSSQLPVFITAYASAGDERSTLMLLFAFFRNRQPTAIVDYFGALTDSEFDFDQGRNRLLAAFDNSDIDRDIYYRQDVFSLIFRDYEQYVPSNFRPFWWHPGLQDFLSSSHRKRAIRQLGIFDYWVSYGFPAHCKPVGEDDFECKMPDPISPQDLPA